LRGGDSLHAMVTADSVQDLELVPGREVQALIKASWIILCPAGEAMRTSARNRLCGCITRITAGDVNAEIAFELAGGNTLAAIITVQSLHELGLKVGDEVCALVTSSHVLLGVQS
jgi:molybdate transport system regulatory protein